MSNNLKLTNLLNDGYIDQTYVNNTIDKEQNSEHKSMDNGFYYGSSLKQRESISHSISNIGKKHEKQEIDRRLQELKDKRRQLLREKQRLRDSYNSSHDNSLKNQRDNMYNQQHATEADIGYLLQNIDASAIDYGSAYLQSNYEYNISSPLKQIDSVCKQPLDQLLKSGFMSANSNSSSDNNIDHQKSVRFKSPQNEQLKISQLAYQQSNPKAFENSQNQYSYQKIFQVHAQQKQIYSPVTKQKQYELKRQMKELSTSKGTNQFFEQLKSHKPVPQKQTKYETNNAIQSSQNNNEQIDNTIFNDQSKKDCKSQSQAFINVESEIDTQEPAQQNTENPIIQQQTQQYCKQENKYLTELQAQNQVNLQLRERCASLSAQVEALKLQLENQENLTEVERTTIALLEQQKHVQAQIQEELKAELKQYQNIERPLYSLLALFNRKFKTPCHNGQLQNTIDAVNNLIDTNWAEVQTIAKSIMQNNSKVDDKQNQANVIAPTTQQTIQIQHALDRLIVTIAKLAAQDPEKLVQLGPDGVQQLFTKIKQQQMNEKKQ